METKATDIPVEVRELKVKSDIRGKKTSHARKRPVSAEWKL